MLDVAPLHTCKHYSCYTTTMGVARCQFHNVPQFDHFYKKVVLRLGEHGDVIETQTIHLISCEMYREL